MRASQPQVPVAKAGIDAKSIKAKGFTLVELLVVISVITMLMGILIPVLSAARRLAKKTVCKSNLHSCGLAFRMYLGDNKNVMPFAVYFPTLPSLEEQALNLKPIGAVLATYLVARKVLICPADVYPPDEYHNTNSTYFEQEGSSYQYNTSLGGIKLGKNKITFTRRRRSFTFLLRDIDVMSDYGGFHAKQKADGSYPAGAYMYLYTDTLVADRERNK